jgi:hypothetical protein
LECHRIRGFNELWCSWVKKSLFEGTVSVKLNNEIGSYFQSAKGVRQGDPWSPTLFNLVAEALTKMVLRAQENDMLVGLADDLIPKGVAVLQYADDTVLCIQHDPDKAINLKLLLYSFELMSGLKINFLKSEIFIIGGDNEIAGLYSDMFGCQVGTLPMKYLGVPISSVALKTSDWDYVDDKLVRKLDAWIGNNASSGAKKVLIDACLSSTLYYPMSMFLLNKTFLEKADKHRKRFFWQKKKDKKSYYMVSWDKVCRSKKKGGLGIKNLRRQNISLLTKWWLKLDTHDGLWQRIVKARYLRNKTIANVLPRFSDSPCWKSLFQVKETYLAGRKLSLKNGGVVRFWEDPWDSEFPLCDTYHVLYDIFQMKGCTIKDFVENNYDMRFFRRLHGDLATQWENINAKVANINLEETDYVITWGLTSNKRFSTKSVYEYLERDLIGPDNRLIWNAKLP